MADIKLEWDSGDIAFWRKRGVEKALLRALTRAGNDAARALKVASSRSVRQRKRFKVSKVNKSLPVFFPRGKQDINSLEWRMDVSGRPVPVSEFSHRQGKRGVSVAINRGKRTLIKGAFVARMRSGHVGVFRRRGLKRLPIDEAFTTRISDVFNDAGMIPAVQARAQNVFSSAFGRLFKMELDKVSGSKG